MRILLCYFLAGLVSFAGNLQANNKIESLEKCFWPSNPPVIGHEFKASIGFVNRFVNTEGKGAAAAKNRLEKFDDYLKVTSFDPKDIRQSGKDFSIRPVELDGFYPSSPNSEVAIERPQLAYYLKGENFRSGRLTLAANFTDKSNNDNILIVRDVSTGKITSCSDGRVRFSDDKHEVCPIVETVSSLRVVESGNYGRFLRDSCVVENPQASLKYAKCFNEKTFCDDKELKLIDFFKKSADPRVFTEAANYYKEIIDIYEKNGEYDLCASAAENFDKLFLSQKGDFSKIFSNNASNDSLNVSEQLEDVYNMWSGCASKFKGKNKEDRFLEVSKKIIKKDRVPSPKLMKIALTLVAGRFYDIGDYASCQKVLETSKLMLNEGKTKNIFSEIEADAWLIAFNRKAIECLGKKIAAALETLNPNSVSSRSNGLPLVSADIVGDLFKVQSLGVSALSVKNYGVDKSQSSTGNDFCFLTKEMLDLARGQILDGWYSTVTDSLYPKHDPHKIIENYNKLDKSDHRKERFDELIRFNFPEVKLGGERELVNKLNELEKKLKPYYRYRGSPKLTKNHCKK